MAWTNDDGLIVRFGLELSQGSAVGKVNTGGTVEQIVCILEAGQLDTSGGLIDPYANVAIPANSRILRATFVVTEAFDSAGDSATLDLGLANADGTYTNLDENGIDVAIAEADIDTAGKSVVCDGALVNATSSALTSVISYPSYDLDTEAFTAGKGFLVIEYETMPYVSATAAQS